jgi:hypothetical protein
MAADIMDALVADAEDPGEIGEVAGFQCLSRLCFCNFLRCFEAKAASMVRAGVGTITSI